MENQLVDSKVFSEESTAEPTDAHSRPAPAWIQAHAQIMGLQHDLGWWYHVRLTQLVCRDVGNGWQVIVKAEKNGRPMVAYINGDSWEDAVEALGKLACSDALDWWPDKYPPRKHRNGE